MQAFLIFLAMFATAFVVASLAVTFFRAATVARARAAGLPEETSEAGVVQLIKNEAEQISTIRIWRLLLERIGHVDRLRKEIEEANLNWSAGRITLMMLMCALLAGSVVAAIPWMPGIAPIVGAVLAGAAPYGFVRFKRAKRMEKFASQFPEAMDSFARALKAGYPLGTALELLAYEQPEPLASEIKKTRDEWRLGTSWEDSLDHLAERIPIAEVRLFAAAVKLQNRVGGRLNEVLSRLAETMRDTASLEGEVRSVSAHSRMTGAVLTALPLCIGVVMFFVNPDYMLKLFVHPSGKTLVTVAIVANVGAHFLIRHIARVKA